MAIPAWFTDRDIFEVLCKKARTGVKVSVALIGDEINQVEIGGNWGQIKITIIQKNGNWGQIKITIIQKNIINNGPPPPSNPPRLPAPRHP